MLMVQIVFVVFFQWLYRNCEHEKKAEQQQKEPPVWNLFHVFESNVMAARKKWLNKKKNINKSKIMRLSWLVLTINFLVALEFITSQWIREVC